jgi:hypothetical protein
MIRSVFGAVAIVAAALFLTGCHSSPPPIVPAEGVVLINDQPLPNAQVQFVPMAQGLGTEYIATGTTDENGRFTLSCKGQAGACACENRVTVSNASPPEKARGQSGEAQAELTRYTASLKNRPIPDQYDSVARTPLVIKVTASQAEYKLELKR